MTKLVNKIVNLNDRRTSMRLCLKEWDALKDVCKRENVSRNSLIETIEKTKNSNLGLTYSTRLFLLQYYRNKSASKTLAKSKKINIAPEKNSQLMAIIKELS